MRQQNGYLYILAHRDTGTLHIGVTSNLMQCVLDLESETIPRAARPQRLVYFERFERVVDAIEAEQRISRWRKKWKINLIESLNPSWRDLAVDLEYSL